jgi:DNA-binding PadR family transcriptional regulator
MDNPGLKTLTTFLDQIRRMAPATYSVISEERARGYGMITRYLDYCLKENLIQVHSTRRTRGRYPSKTYILSEKGARLLDIVAPEKKANRRAGA